MQVSLKLRAELLCVGSYARAQPGWRPTLRRAERAWQDERAPHSSSGAGAGPAQLGGSWQPCCSSTWCRACAWPTSSASATPAERRKQSRTTWRLHSCGCWPTLMLLGGCTVPVPGPSATDTRARAQGKPVSGRGCLWHQLVRLPGVRHQACTPPAALQCSALGCLAAGARHGRRAAEHLAVAACGSTWQNRLDTSWPYGRAAWRSSGEVCAARKKTGEMPVAPDG